MAESTRRYKLLRKLYRDVILRQRRRKVCRKPDRHAFNGLETLEPRVLLSATIELSSLLAANGGDGTDGFVVPGANAHDFSATSVSDAGDVNGDGFDDLIIGAFGADANGISGAGQTYVVFGSGDGFDASVDPASLNGMNGFVINGGRGGDDFGDATGRAVNRAGDVNGDGFGDLIIGARTADYNGEFRVGASYVVFGSGDGFTGSLDLSLLDGSNGFSIHGVERVGYFGAAVNTAGDLNGDGFDDLVIGAVSSNLNDNPAGDVYVIFGKAGGFTPSLSVSSLDGSNGFMINAIGPLDFLGESVSSAGDVNGDGLDDLIIGGRGVDGVSAVGPGAAYVILGQTDPFPAELALTSLDGTHGFVIKGTGIANLSGRSVSGAGDVNGDGYADLLIGAQLANVNGLTWAGQSYVVFGAAAGFSANFALSSLDGTNGFTINGNAAYRNFGSAVSSAGDVNGDGIDDLIIGAEHDDYNGPDRVGESYVLFGKTSGFSSTVDVSSLDGANGFVIRGINDIDILGNSVDTAGDLNGDGFDDLLIASRLADPDGDTDAGLTYVVFGGDFTGAVTHQGTVAGETIVGASQTFADVIVAGQGDDTLIGGIGEDVLLGGEGDDVMIVNWQASVGTFRRVDGGRGVDTLRFIDDDPLDLTQIADNRITGIERIELGGGGSGILSLSALEVLNLSDTSNTVTVEGDRGDQVVVEDGWQSMGQQTLDGKLFNVYTQGAATLKVLVDVTVAINVPSFFDLSSLLDAQGGDGTDGFVINGVEARDQSGGSVSSAGDINGDGYDDLILGATGVDVLGATGFDQIRAGASYVVFGQPDGHLSALELSTLDGTNGFVINGIDGDDNAGHSVSAAGDVNGDGLGDLVIGAIFADVDGGTNAGESYVVFGREDGFSPILNLASLDGTNGFVLAGLRTGDQTGVSVSGAGDVNGDGYSDLVIGADESTSFYSHSVYVVFGAAGGYSKNVDLSALNGSNGFAIDMIAARDHTGFSVSGGGDVNGDGIDDVVVGAYRADPNDRSSSGQSYVIFGQHSPFTSILNLSSLDGSNGFAINGVSAGDRSGRSVSGGGDVNGDGFGDIVIGARRADPNGQSGAGESYVVFGASGGFGPNVELSSLDGFNGFVINGVKADDRSGYSVSGAGDVNGDGVDDLIIGALRVDANGQTNAGASYLVYGKVDGFEASFDLSSLDGNNGILINGIHSEDESGRSVSAAGDLNGDGFDDLVIGAHYADPNGSQSGQSYVLFGGNSTGEVTHLGTSVDDSFIGTSLRDVMVGGQGDDTLVGGGGVDVLRGGQGEDVLAISDLTFHRVAGGHGVDTLRIMDGFRGNLDLTEIADSRLTGIEVIDLSGSGVNRLTLNALEVLNLSDHSNTLTITGDFGHHVEIGFGWIRTSQQGQMGVYMQGAATLMVDSDVSVSVSIELSALLAANGGDGSVGFVINGANANDSSGGSVNSAGDVNGDGFDDVIVGASGADPNGKSAAGASYVVFGKAGDFLANVNMSLLDGTNGFVLNGVDAGDESGRAVSSAGDINGDGFDDLVIGSRADPDNKRFVGESYVVFGTGGGFASSIDLSSLDGTNGFTVEGLDAGDFSGHAVSVAGDINGDGFDDVIIGALGADPNGKGNAGESYVIFGKAGGFSPNLNLLSLDGVNGFVINGGDGSDQSGISVSSAGDVNGDGFHDLVIGADRADGNVPNPKSIIGAGEAYVVFGKATAFSPSLDLSTLDGTIGFVLNGINLADFTGYSVSTAGDVNGDGFDDLIIGANHANVNGKPNAGASYVVFGQEGNFSTAFDLSTLDGTRGFVINGIDSGDTSGHSVSTAGDVNGDGFDDLIIGTERADSNGNRWSGESYVVFGKAMGFAASLELSQLDGTIGFLISGIDSYDYAGRSVSTAGDINGDGFDDLIIGAFGVDVDGNMLVGQSYVIFGRKFTNSVALAGSSTNDTLVGTPANDVIVAGQGSDTLVGNGGVDVLIGGEGNDVLTIADLTFQRVAGGSGFDTLLPEGTGMTLDLTHIPDNKLTGIEQIDLTHSGDDTLILTVLEVLNLSDTSNTLTVWADAGDTVDRGSGWTFNGTKLISDLPFDVYTQGAAILQVLNTELRLPAAVGIDSAGVLYDVDIQTGATSNPRSTGIDHAIDVVYGLNGVLYTVTADEASTAIPNALYTLDPFTGHATLIGSTGLNDIHEGDLAVDPITGTLYAVTGHGSGSNANSLLTIDLQTGVASIVGQIPVGSDSDLSGLAFDAEGNLFVLANPILGDVVANSTVDFSSQQGQDGWFYGYYDLDDGGDFKQLSAYTAPPIFVTTDDAAYREGDTIVVSGEVDQVFADVPVTMQVFDSDGNLIEISQLSIESSGRFAIATLASGPLWQGAGIYTIRASYGEDRVAQTTFALNLLDSVATPVPVTTDQPMWQFSDDSGFQTSLGPNTALPNGPEQSLLDFLNELAGDLGHGLISDAQFVNGVQRLLDSGRLVLPHVTPQSWVDPSVPIPTWVRNNALWWTQGIIEFVNFEQTLIWMVGQGYWRIPFDGTPPDSSVPPLSVETDVAFYSPGNEVSVFGLIKSYDPNDGIPLTLQITDPSGDFVSIGQIPPELDGTYAQTYLAEGSLWQDLGAYTIRAFYGTEFATSDIELGNFGTTTPTPQAPSSAPVAAPTGLQVFTDRTAYSSGDVVSIQGNVGSVLAGHALTYVVIAPNANIVSIGQLDPNSDGSFTTQFVTGGPLMKQLGTYTIQFHYGSDSTDVPFEFVSSVPEGIQVTTNRSAYVPGDVVSIQGNVGSVLAGHALTYVVIAPNANIVSIGQLVPNSDGSFTTQFVTGGPLMKQLGTYTIRFHYGSDSTDVPFEFVSSVPEGIQVTTNSAAYVPGDVVSIQGNVGSVLAGHALTYVVVAPNANIVSIGQLDPNSDGSFMTQLVTGGPLMKQLGTYTIQFHYGSDSTDVPFELVSRSFTGVDEQWAVRRWTNANSGPLSLELLVGDAQPASTVDEDGTRVSVLLNGHGGTEVFTQNVQVGSATLERIFVPFVDANLGDAIDFAVAPKFNDISDSTFFAAQIRVGSTERGTLLTVDKATGSVISSTSLDQPLSNVGGTLGLHYDARQNLLYVADGGDLGVNGSILTLDAQTGSVAEVGATGLVHGLSGLALAPMARISDHHLFYNNSAFDGYDESANPQDDAAIATDKEALLPGGTATFANYGSFHHGINGIMIDIDNLPVSALGADDFEFRMGHEESPDEWALMTSQPEVFVRPGQNAGDPDRVTLIWADHEAVKNQWLQVKVKANDHTGLVSSEEFYFGNVIGETGDHQGEDGAIPNTIVDMLDLGGVRSNATRPGTSASIADRYDINRDGRVNLFDLLIVRNRVANSDNVLSLINTPLPVMAEHHEVVFAAGSASPGCEENDECLLPTVLSIVVGDRVTWRIVDSAARTVTSGNIHDGPDGTFDSSLILAGRTFTHEFTQVGEFPYFNMVHPWVQGQVIVEARPIVMESPSAIASAPSPDGMESAPQVTPALASSSPSTTRLSGSMHRWQLTDWRGERNSDRMGFRRGTDVHRFQLSQLLGGGSDDFLQRPE